MPGTQVNTADLDKALDAAMECVCCLKKPHPRFPEVPPDKPMSGQDLETFQEQELESFQKRLRDASPGQEAIRKVEGLVAGENPVSFAGLNGGSYHMLAFQLFMRLRAVVETP